MLCTLQSCTLLHFSPLTTNHSVVKEKGGAEVCMCVCVCACACALDRRGVNKTPKIITIVCWSTRTHVSISAVRKRRAKNSAREVEGEAGAGVAGWGISRSLFIAVKNF